MHLTRDESRAITFVAVLLLLAAAARMAGRPEPVKWAGPIVDRDSLEDAARAGVEEAGRRARPLGPRERIDPNTAPEEELDRLPGVGPSLARRIIAARQDSRFRSLDDLTRVRGIGERSVRKLAKHLRLPASAPGGSASDREAHRAMARAVGHASDQASERVDVNRATAAELQRLPGIGPALAARIVAYRDSAGRFRAVEDLAEVRGIGPATVEKIRQRVRINP